MEIEDLQRIEKEKQYQYNQMMIQWIKEKKMPRYLYKYRPLWNEEEKQFNKFTLDILLNNTLWFANAASFNDPFDFKMVNIPPKKGEQSFIELYRRLGFSEEDILRLQFKNPYDEDKALQTLEYIFNQRGICCFSEIVDNILMWSHYADNHTGICIEFDLLKEPSFFHLPVKMTYQKDYPEGCFFEDNKTYTYTRISTKYIDWQYEKEYRLLRNKKGLYRFNPQAISGIYFGCRILPEVVKNFQLLMHENINNKILYYEGDINPKEYKIDFKLIQINK